MSHAGVSAIVPAGGLGSRVGQLSEYLPKEMLPLGDRTVMRAILGEAVAAGVDEIVVVTRRAKPLLVDHCRQIFREIQSQECGYQVDLKIAFQRAPTGLGDAVRVGLRATSNDWALVLLGDCVYPDAALSRTLIARCHQFAAATVGVMAVPQSESWQFGVYTIDPSADELRIVSAVEKPRRRFGRNTAYVATGRYVLPRELVELIDRVEPDASGEIGLTEALDLYCRDAMLLGTIYEKSYQDVGSVAGWVGGLLDSLMTMGGDTSSEVQDLIQRFLQRD